MRPLAVDLYCGLGGWTEGLLAEGYDVVGFDIERHEYGDHAYPAQLVIQDVTTLHGSQFKDATLFVASPPCQAYSYRAMPWKRAKALPPPDNTLFEACFRIQREACAAAGRHIPLVVENVRGAQRWVGRARWNYGSFYLWGDVPALMPMTLRAAKAPGHSMNKGAPKWNMHHKECVASALEGQNPDGRKGIPHRTNGHWANPDEYDNAGGTKYPISGHAWYRQGHGAFSSGSSARKAASAMIAKIPLALSRHIAAVYRP